MIWDRYDDAMDDLRDDKIDLNAKIGELEKKLTELGVKFDPYIKPEEESVRDHNEMYWNDSRVNISLEARYNYLKRILAEADGKPEAKEKRM